MIRMRGLHPTIVVILAALASGATVHAQSTSGLGTGIIEGTVVDEGGTTLPGATVTLHNLSIDVERVVTTDAGGRFRGLLLPPGSYRVSAHLEGFAPLVKDGIDLLLGQTVTLRLPLGPSTAVDEVGLICGPALVEPTRAEASSRLDEGAIRGLPSRGRSLIDLVGLAPGVTIVQGPDGVGLSINGQQAIHNNVSVDGADFNNPFFGDQRGGRRPPFTIDLDAIQEVTVVSAGAPAELGRAASGFVQVVTRSGANQVHGTAHFHLASGGLSARAKTGQPVPGDRAPRFDFSQQQLGVTVGGPLKKDRVFYFLALDGQRGRSTRQTDPERIESPVVDFFAALGSPAENGPIRRTDDARALLAKLDWNTSGHLLTLRYSHSWSEQVNGTFDVDSWGRSANGTERGASHAVAGSVTSYLSPDLLNEFRFQYSRESRPREYDGPRIAGSRPLPDTSFDFDRSYRFGMPFFLPVAHVDERVQLGDSLSLVRGTHLIKAGFEFNAVRAVQTFVGLANGRWVFSSTDGFLSYAANPRYVECSDGSRSPAGVCPPGSAVSGPVLLYRQQAGVGGLSAEQAGTQSIPQTEPALYIQDQWRPGRRVAIQYGVRWEGQVQPEPLTAPADALFAPFIGATSEGEPFPSDGTLPSDYRMFQPRLGLAWDVGGDGRTVVRANAGVFYARVPGLTLASPRSTDGSRGQTVSRSSATAASGPVPAYPGLLSPSEIGSSLRPDVFVFSKDFRNPRSYAASLAVERELFRDLAVLVQYSHAKGVHLTRFVDRNDPLLGDGQAPGPWSLGLPPDDTGGIGTLTTVESSAKSLYRGLTLAAHKRWSKGWQAQASYTLSKDLSDDDQLDPFSFRYAKVTDLAAEYGPSDRDQRHRLSGWVRWAGPGRVAMSLRYVYRSPQPKSVTREGRDAATPRDRLDPDGSVTPRNQARKDDGFSSLDLRLSRPIRVGRRAALEPVIDVFNLLNSANLRRPEAASLIFDVDSTVQSRLGDPRRLQLGLRYVW